MEKFIVIWNDGVFYCDGKNVLSMEEVKSIFEGKNLCVMDDEDELVEIGVKELVEMVIGVCVVMRVGLLMIKGYFGWIW